MKTLRLLLLLLFLCTVWQCLYYYPKLPDTVVSQVNAAESPTSYMSKTSFFVLNMVMALVVVLVFGVMSLFLDRIPVALWNLPRRKYWLAPERRADTMDFVSKQLLVCGIATMIFVIYIFQAMIDYNLSEGTTKTLPGGKYVLGGYLAFIAIWIVVFMKRFLKKTEKSLE
jgi:uncharacterized membrane protein